MFHTTPSLTPLSRYKSLLLIIVALTSPSSAKTVFTQSVSFDNDPEKSTTKTQSSSSITTFSLPTKKPSSKTDEMNIDRTYINQMLSRRTRDIPIPNPVTQN